MANPEALARVLIDMSGQSSVLVPDQPKLDLDLYLQNYTGRTRFDRLILIGQNCLPLSVDAFKTAVAEAKRGSDVSRYEYATHCLRLTSPGDPDSRRDDEWVEKTERTNKAETARLEAELKGYRNNLIKESIRIGHQDLGRHFENVGKLNEALDVYGRMRQDVSTTKHIIDCAMHLASVSLQRRDWTMALTNMGKIVGVQASDEKILQAYTKIVSGISLLGLGHFNDAAKSFLQTDFSVPPTDYNHLVSPNDIAVYGGLLALATMDRKELQTKVLDNQSFRTFLEHEPHIRKAISMFVNGRYSNCLSILEASRGDYLLDIYLQGHVPDIYSRIRSKCIVQYFVPFSRVTLESLDTAFASPGQSVERELVNMIREGVLKARIDARNKLLVAVHPDARSEMQRSALNVARNYEHEAKERLRRISIMAAGLEVISAKRAAGNTLGGASMTESQFDDPRRSAFPGVEIQG